MKPTPRQVFGCVLLFVAALIFGAVLCFIRLLIIPDSLFNTTLPATHMNTAASTHPTLDAVLGAADQTAVVPPVQTTAAQLVKSPLTDAVKLSARALSADIHGMGVELTHAVAKLEEKLESLFTPLAEDGKTRAKLVKPESPLVMEMHDSAALLSHVLRRLARMDARIQL